jgi:hypothetical protein
VVGKPFKKIKGHWSIDFGRTAQTTKVYYAGQIVGGIQSLTISLDVESAIPKLQLTILDSQLRVTRALCKGAKADIKIESRQVCPKCGEEERIENKTW